MTPPPDAIAAESPAPPMTDKRRVRSALRVVSGNFLEMYDFSVFGYYAPAIGRAFFPSQSEFASLILSLMTFGVGFLMRPLGAVVLGSYIDRRGRRAGLLLALSLMAVGTLSIAVLPGYQTLGLLAPLLIVMGRLLQGFSAGAEPGGVSVYLAEIAPPNRRGLYVACQPGSQQIAVIVVATIGMLLSTALSPAQLDAWGWRIPFLIGCLIIPLLFMLRRSLPETDEFLKRAHRKRPKVMASLAANWRTIVVGMLLVTMPTVWFQTITAYTPTFGKEVLKLTAMDSLIVTLCVGVSNLVLLPTMGGFSDRVGRKPLMVVFTVVGALTAYPALLWLASAPSFERLLMVELWLSFVYSGYNGPMVSRLAEIMPRHVRVTGFALAYSLATAVFGGFTPAISQYLIHLTGNKAMPGIWLSIAAVCALGATLAAREIGPSTEDRDEPVVSGAGGLRTPSVAVSRRGSTLH